MKLDSDAHLDPFLFCTIHRAENVDDESRIRFILGRLAESEVPVMLAAHPRLIAQAKRLNIDLLKGGIKVIDSQSYLKTIRLMINCVGVVTDSGGLQKESFLLGKPTLILRKETEWPEVLRGGSSILDFNLANLNTFHLNGTIEDPKMEWFGDGKSSEKILQLISAKLQHA